jgi:transposase
VYGAVRIDAHRPTVHFRFEDETFNRDNFVKKFLEPVVRYYRARGQKVHMILDNAGYHTKARTWAEKRSDDIELHFLPPYSPDLNPQEQVWRKAKASATHNRYFATLGCLHRAVFRRLNRFQGNPASLRNIVRPWV